MDRKGLAIMVLAAVILLLLVAPQKSRFAQAEFRSEPINPRTPVSIFNLSTIPPDTMRPKFEISPEYQ